MSVDKSFDLKQFEKKKKIGEGSYGKVYIVEDKSTKKIYAAKISKNEFEAANPKEMLDLSREVNIISKIRHPSVLGFIGYSHTKPVIVTEFSPNGSLKDILHMQKKNRIIPGYDTTKKLIIMYGIANGMAYLHLNNIIHRNLKPDNIFLDDYLCPKIADFGLSKITNETWSVSGIKTVEGAFKGTPRYMAPEIWASQEYSFPIDVYAYSLIIYEMMTGDQPFKNYHQFQLLIDVGRNHKRPEFLKKIPQSYIDLIQSCWADQPKDRPTFKDIAEKLRNDPSFLLDGVVKEDYYAYIDFLDKSITSFNSTKKIIHLSDFINPTSKTYKKVFISQNKTIKQELQKIIEEEKIDEMDKIVENEPKVERQFKFISSSTFNDLDYYCQDLVIDIEDGKEDSIVLVAQGFVEGSNDFPKEPEIGIKYFEYAISKENVEAMETYGKLLFEGESIPKNEEKAVQILTDAAEKYNSANAKLQLSKIILSHQSFDVNNKNENINWPLAKKYSKEAADAGNIEAILHYADLATKEKKNKFGEIHSDVVESFNYYKKAVDKGNPTAMALYGLYIEFGLAFTKPDPEAAIQYYKQSYEKGDLTGFALLGSALYQGIGGLIKNEEDGETLIQISFEQNNIYGIRSYACDIPREKEERNKYLKILVDRGDVLGYLNYGIAYYRGDGIEKNVELGMKYLERAIEEGSPRAAHILGMDYFNMNPMSNLKKDIEKGRKYMKMAIDNGSYDALFSYPSLLLQQPDAAKYKDEIEKYLKMGISLGNILPKNIAE